MKHRTLALLAFASLGLAAGGCSLFHHHHHAPKPARKADVEPGPMEADPQPMEMQPTEPQPRPIEPQAADQ